MFGSLQLTRLVDTNRGSRIGSSTGPELGRIIFISKERYCVISTVTLTYVLYVASRVVLASYSYVAVPVYADDAVPVVVTLSHSCTAQNRKGRTKEGGRRNCEMSIVQ